MPEAKTTEAVIVGEVPESVPLPALVAARTAIASFATVVGAPLVMFAGLEVHVMLMDENPALVSARTERMVDLFRFWGVKPTVIEGEPARAHVDALTKG